MGENQTDGDEKCVFIKGIIKAKLGTEVEEKGVYFNENVWNGIYSDVGKIFSGFSQWLDGLQQFQRLHRKE